MQNLIPDIWQMVLAYVSIQGWIIDPNIESFFHVSHWVLVLSPHYAEVIYANHMTRDVTMVIDGGQDLLVFFEPLSKSSGGLSYILLITIHSITLVSIDNLTLFHHRFLVLGGHQEVFDGDTSSEVDLYPMFVVCLTLSLSPW